VSVAKAKELWISLEACLPSQYRTLEWDKLPAMVQQDMDRVVAQFIQERDAEVITAARNLLKHMDRLSSPHFEPRVRLERALRDERKEGEGG